MNPSFQKRRAQEACAESMTPDERRFAELVLGKVVRTQRETLEWVAQFSERHAAELRDLREAEAAPAGDQTPSPPALFGTSLFAKEVRPNAAKEWGLPKWIDEFAAWNQAHLQALREVESEIRGAKTERPPVAAQIQEIWSSSKHPRLGAPPNPGWFVSTGGPGAGNDSGLSSRTGSINNAGDKPLHGPTGRLGAGVGYSMPNAVHGGNATAKRATVTPAAARRLSPPEQFEADVFDALRPMLGDGTKGTITLKQAQWIASQARRAASNGNDSVTINGRNVNLSTATPTARLAAAKAYATNATGGELRIRLGKPSQGMTNPQAHHDLPQAERFRKHWKRVGLDIEDPKHGRWVEGGKAGDHQKWSREFNREWDKFFAKNPKATKKQIFSFMKQLRKDPRFQ